MERRDRHLSWGVGILASPSYLSLSLTGLLREYSATTRNRLEDVNFFGSLGNSVFWLVSAGASIVSMGAGLVLVASRTVSPDAKILALLAALVASGLSWAALSGAI